MAKISIDVEYVKSSLEQIGYVISDCIERENNGLNWQIKFSNSGACVTIYDTNIKKNTVVNGKCDDAERKILKNIVDMLKCKEFSVHPLNQEIVGYINSHRETSYYDFKQKWHTDKKESDLLHDILCLSNNTDFKNSFLIIGVCDNGDVIGVNEWRKSNEIYDFLRSKPFAGGHIPEIELIGMYYMYHKIDVLMIKSSKDAPFFLTKQFKDVGTQIYTRVGDTNTPKTETAQYLLIEKLWKRHFEI